MSKKPKQKVSKNQRVKSITKPVDPTNSMCPVWGFEMIDRDGKFAFDLTRNDLNPKFLLDKLIGYSSMTWQEITRHTHDGGKSKHHRLEDLDRLSKAARERIERKNLSLELDALFSFALDNVKRLIGIRQGAVFQVIWYDANHEFAPSEKKHT